MSTKATALDRLIGYFAPRVALQRQRARVASDILVRHYEGGGTGRRTQGWKRPGTDANSAAGGTLANLRNQARDLVRNNPHADNAVDTIADHTVGWGIVAKAKPINKRAMDAWEAWAGTPECDSDGRHDFAGLQKLVMRAVVESGEVLVRRRFRRPEDGLPIPMQLQVLEADYIDTLKTGLTLSNGGRIIHGVEFDPLGRRAAYWLFREHPGAEIFGATTLGGVLGGTSVRVPAESILHVYRQERPGQVRGVSWFAPVMLKLKDYDDYDDAQLMKQKIAACLAVITTDIDGTAPPLGTTDSSVNPMIDSLEPGMIINAAPGRTVTVVDPPRVGEFAAYSEIALRAVATGLGLPYEELTGDYSRVNFSSARMSRLRHWSRVDDWRWQTLVPQFCDPAWRWAMQAGQVAGLVGDNAPAADWTVKPPQMIEPQAEAGAYKELLRIGAISWPEMVRERGFDPEALLAEIEEWNKKLDDAGIVFDGDPRKTSSAGLTQARPSGTLNPDPSEFADPDAEPPKPPNGQAAPRPDDDDDMEGAEA